MFGNMAKNAAKDAIVKVDMNKNGIPDAKELLDAIEAGSERLEKAADAVEPYLNMIDAQDILSVINLMDRRGKFTAEQKVDFAAKGAEYLKALQNVDDLAVEAKKAAEAVEKELFGKLS